MKAVLLAVLVVLGGQFAHAQDATPVQGVQLRCAFEADGQEFEYAFNHAAKRVWFVEAGADEGYELNITQYAPTPGQPGQGWKVIADSFGADYELTIAGTRLTGTQTEENERGKRVTTRFSGSCY